MSRPAKRTALARPATRLTQKDLAEQIGRLAEELFGADGDDAEWVPVPISFREYAERMKRFLVYN